MNALQQRGFAVHRTDAEGDVAVVTDGSHVSAVSG
jgi:competence protein ComEC